MARPRSQPTEDRRPIFHRAFELVRAGRFTEADAMVRDSVAKPSKDAEGLRVRARLAVLAGKPGEARTLIDRSLRLEPHAEAWLVLADLQLRMDEIEDGIASALAAVAESPEDPEVRIQAASMFLRVRGRGHADEVLRPLADAPPMNPGTHRRYTFVLASMLIQDDRSDEAIAPLQAALDTATLPTERRAALELLGQAFEKTGRHEEAFAAAASCQALEPGRFDPTRHAASIDRLIGRFDRSTISRFPSGSTDDRPVFIAGMPRSGTSLIDRIIDAHPDAVGIGELPLLERVLVRGLERADLEPFGPEELTNEQCEHWSEIADRGLRVFDEAAPGASRVVGKSLANPRLLGIAAALYPRSRVIHVVRDPRDVAISCHFGRFRAEAIPYAGRLEWVAAAWRDTERLMTHWTDVLDLPMLTIAYESLVTTPDAEVRRLIEFLDLPWDDRCLAFHESSRPLQTLSVDQVARPLHAGSVGRHRRHASEVEAIDWPVPPSSD